jgi:hypothetical protein
MDERTESARERYMLTRGQVAKRLGRSVATVRRMEGHELHPKRDADGVLRFDPAEVQRARVRRDGRGVRGRRAWLDKTLDERESTLIDYDFDDDRAMQDDRSATEVRVADERIRTAVEEALARRDEQDRKRREDEVRRADEERRRGAEEELAEFVRVQGELFDMIASCSRSELQRLLRDPEFSEALESVLSAR